jgi:PPOX class probable F420-dependent enzyme
MVKLTAAVKALLDAPNFAHLATLMPDGSPHVTVVWLDTDGDLIRFNTAEGRVKPRNLRRDPRVAISVIDQNNPYAWVSIRGRVVELTPEGADAHIDRLAGKYLGQDTYPMRREGEVRLTAVIEPEHVSTSITG